MTKKDELEAALKGEGCLGRSADDEPVFTICGRDPVAGDVLRYWADKREMLASRTGTLDAQEKDKIKNARLESIDMDGYPKKHRVPENVR